jgi:hypothetical protein
VPRIPFAPAALLLSAATLLAACAPLPPGTAHWAESMERERCVREGHWWRPGDRIDGSGRCDHVTIQR